MPENLQEQRMQKYREALQKTYAGCLFDIDGTLTVRGDEFIPAFVLQTLAVMCMRVPMAVCSARKLSLAYEKMAPIFMRSTDPQYCQANWVMICENGGVGYYYDGLKKDYVQFFKVDYPYPEAHRESLFIRIKNVCGDKLSVAFMNEVSMVFRPLNVEDQDRTALAARSREIAEIAVHQLDIADPKRLLKVGDAGIGVSVFPFRGDKNHGTVQFAKFLHDKKGINVSEDFSDLVVIGDQPQPNGNDEGFLNGKYGTSFTVGETHPDNIFPLPVYDLQSGKTLTGPEGTIYLLNNLKFKNL